jgi:hypothetical protein
MIAYLEEHKKFLEGYFTYTFKVGGMGDWEFSI